jgi:hypothetical protein
MSRIGVERVLLAAAAVLGTALAVPPRAWAPPINRADKATKKALQAAIKDCKPASKTITEYDFKDYYGLGRIEKSNRTQLFMTVSAVAPADVENHGLDPARRTEVNFYRVGGNGQIKVWDAKSGPVCQFIFAWPIAATPPARIPPALKGVVLPARGQTSYAYVYRQPEGTQFIALEGKVSANSEIAFPVTITWEQIVGVYGVNSQGRIDPANLK